MIVARFCEKSKGKLVAGSCTIDGYSGADHGWFPIESFNFGFDEKGDGAAAGAAGQGGGAKPAGGVHPPASAGGAGKDAKKKKEYSQLSMEKQVDAVTCLLMEQAMSEAGTKKGTDSKEQSKIEVDIHVLASVQISIESNSYLFTSIMIHLEAVNILGWEIRGSGDNRPSESVKLRYDRAAMVYVPTPNAIEIKKEIGPKGWDQTSGLKFGDSKEFNWPDKKWQEYLPKRS